MRFIIIPIIFLSFIFSEINLSGDARIRPRLDIIDYGNNRSSIDLYYLYRARLNIDADIGGGWFFQSKLGTNDVSGMVKMGVKEDYTTGPGNFNSARPQVDFLNLYYGIKKDNFGFWGGAFPIEHNGGLDIHFYPDKMVDVPWLLWNNSSTTGFAGYIYKLNWFVSIDDNNVEVAKEDTITLKHIDPFTIGFDFRMKWNEYMNIHPRALISINDMSEPWPMTFGLDIFLQEVFSIKSSFSYHYTTQFINENYKYNGSHLRFKINAGQLTFWTDTAEYVDQMDDNSKINYMYIWIDYNYSLFDSDIGSLSIKPTIRYQNGKSGNSNYNRMKFELTTEIKFK